MTLFSRSQQAAHALNHLGQRDKLKQNPDYRISRPTEDEPQNPSDLFEDDEAWEKAKRQLT